MSGPELKFYTNIVAPSLTENGSDVINAAELDARGYITQNQTITVSGDATGSGSTSIQLTLSSSGVSPGTYSEVTVDSKGRVIQGSAGSSNYALTTITQNYNATTGDGIILSNAQATVTLPDPTLVSGKLMIVKRIFANGNTTINVANNGTIDGKLSIVIQDQYSSISVVSNGTVWYII